MAGPGEPFGKMEITFARRQPLIPGTRCNRCKNNIKECEESEERKKGRKEQRGKRVNLGRGQESKSQERSKEHHQCTDSMQGDFTKRTDATQLGSSLLWSYMIGLIT
jgi:hypothetical protein